MEPNAETRTEATDDNPNIPPNEQTPSTACNSDVTLTNDDADINGDDTSVIQIIDKQFVENSDEIVQDDNQNNNGLLKIQEWTSMEHLLSKIPLKAQKGLATFDLELTCVDAVDDYLALGTSVGLIYWYRRSTNLLERLKIEGNTSPITNVRIISSIDYIVAAGTKSGIISIFQIPKIGFDDDVAGNSIEQSIAGKDDHASQLHFPQPSSPNGDLATKKKVQIFTVRDMHKSKITALEWSTNGIKLFSGDFNGLVIYTEMDYCSGVSKSVQLWNETCEIVQLSYAHKSLVISSIYQTLLFKTDVNSCQKIGTQERKALGNFGAVFESGLWNKNLKLYVIRPGLRIWIADFEGSIKNTIVLKDWYDHSSPNIDNSTTSTSNGDLSTDTQQATLPLQFGLIYNFLGKYLLTATSSYLFLIDPVNIQIVTSFPINILSLGINGGEIFVLEGSRHLVRLSNQPDPYLVDVSNQQLNNSGGLMDQPWPDTFNFISNKFKKTTAAFQKSAFLNTVKNVILETNDYLLQDSSRITLSSLSMVPPSFYDIPDIRVSENTCSSEMNNCEEDAQRICTSHFEANNDNLQDLSVTVGKFDKISQESFKEIVVAQYKPELGTSSTSKRKSKTKKQKLKDGNLSSNPSGSATPNTLMSDSVSVYSTSTNNSEGGGIMIINNNSGEACSASVTNSASSSPTNSSGDGIAGPSRNKMSDDLINSTSSVEPSLSINKNQNQESDKLLEKMAVSAFGTISVLDDVKHYNEQRQLETNPSDLESKEIMLAKLLNWSELLPENVRLEQENADVITGGLANTQVHAKDSNQIPSRTASEATPGDLAAGYELSTTCSSESTVKEEVQNVNNINNESTNNNSLDDSSLDIYTKYGNYNYNHHLSSITSNMSFGPPSGSSNIINKGRGSVTNCSDSYNGEFGDEKIYKNSYCSRSDDEVGNNHDVQLDQLVAASCGGRSGLDGFGAASSLSGRSSNSLVYLGGANSLLLSQDMNVDGVIGNDEWIYYKLPSAVTSIAASDSYVICIDTKNRVYYSMLKANNCNLRWIKADYTSNQMAVSANGQVVWRLLNGTLYSLTFPSMDGPFTVEGEWIDIGSGVKSISVDNEVGWMVKTNGTVHICQRIKDGKPIPQQIFEAIPCPHTVDQITILGSNVWALTDNGKLIYRNKISVINLPGSEWVQFKFSMPVASLTSCSVPAISILTISLGPCDALWFMDTQYNLYFINGITYNTPGGNSDSVWVVNVANCCMNKEADARPTFLTTSNAETTTPPFGNWKTRFVETLKSPILSLLPSKPGPVLSAKCSSVWFSQYGSSEAYANQSIITGHRWEHVQFIGPSKTCKWASIYGNGIYHEHGLFWLLDTKKKLYHLSQKGKMEELKLPDKLINGDEVGSIICAAPAPEALWVLTSKGKIFGRCNMNLENDIGEHWNEIPLSTLESVTLVHVSCGSDVAWACDSRGKIYIRIGSLSPPQAVTDMCAPWIQVDGGPISSQGAKFIKVYVGANGHIVWALDNHFNVYTRVAIFSDVPIGTEWVLVSGIEAESLAISDAHVWALSPKGQIFCRHGLSSTNFIGDYWRRIPGQAKMLTVSVCNQVWALDTNGNLMKHLEEVLDFPRSNAKSVLTPTAKLTPEVDPDPEDTGDWELLG